jgi:hypothetical protein
MGTRTRSPAKRTPEFFLRRAMAFLLRQALKSRLQISLASWIYSVTDVENGLLLILWNDFQFDSGVFLPTASFNVKILFGIWHPVGVRSGQTEIESRRVTVVRRLIHEVVLRLNDAPINWCDLEGPIIAFSRRNGCRTEHCNAKIALGAWRLRRRALKQVNSVNPSVRNDVPKLTAGNQLCLLARQRGQTILLHVLVLAIGVFLRQDCVWCHVKYASNIPGPFITMEKGT